MTWDFMKRPKTIDPVSVEYLIHWLHAIFHECNFRPCFLLGWLLRTRASRRTQWEKAPDFDAEGQHHPGEDQFPRVHGGSGPVPAATTNNRRLKQTFLICIENVLPEPWWPLKLQWNISIFACRETFFAPSRMIGLSVTPSRFDTFKKNVVSVEGSNIWGCGPVLRCSAQRYHTNKPYSTSRIRSEMFGPDSPEFCPQSVNLHMSIDSQIPHQTSRLICSFGVSAHLRKFRPTMTQITLVSLKDKTVTKFWGKIDSKETVPNLLTTFNKRSQKQSATYRSFLCVPTTIHTFFKTL